MRKILILVILVVGLIHLSSGWINTSQCLKQCIMVWRKPNLQYAHSRPKLESVEWYYFKCMECCRIVFQENKENCLLSLDNMTNYN